MTSPKSILVTAGNVLALLALMAGSVVIFVLCVGLVVAYMGAILGGIAGATVWVYRAVTGG